MTYIGIDISKSWFDGVDSTTGSHHQYGNDVQGWDEFAKSLPKDAWVVMEASGPYYLGLASFLFDRKIPVSVLNPLVIRRYSQMRLNRTKTDAKDAQLIAEYAREQPLTRWIPPSAINQTMRQIISLCQGLIRQRTMLLGQKEAFVNSPATDLFILEVVDEQINRIKSALNVLEDRLKELILTHYRSCYEAVTSIPGVGPKTAILLICLTDGFSKFDDARKLASYVGICPRIYTSGSSIKGRGSICKIGSSGLRKLLYMCTWTAKTCNPGCKQMYDRMKQAGKPERVIKIALAHKLLRQAYSVGTSGEHFSKDKALAA
ncbi:MAG: IS110 family transposase [Balneolales bacterium]|nr:IS110 family transposase [Balneolales bacterium]